MAEAQQSDKLNQYLTYFKDLTDQVGFVGAVAVMIILAMLLVWWYWEDVKRKPFVLSSLEFLRFRKPDKNVRQNIFSVVSSMTEEWQADLNHQILLQAQREKIFCITYVLSQNHDANERRALMNRLSDDRDLYSAGIAIISGWPEESEDKLVQFAKSFDKPIVFVDHTVSRVKSQIPPNVSFVSVNDSVGAQLAATAIRLTGPDPTAKILIIAGFAKQARAEVFKNTIRQRYPNCEIITSNGGKFLRHVARRIATEMISDAARNRPFDFVFCTSDAMTLGCIDAVLSLQSEGLAKAPSVIGYDGVDSTQKMLEDRFGPLRYLVVQDTHAIASATVSQLIAMMKKENSERQYEVSPSFLPSIS